VTASGGFGLTSNYKLSRSFTVDLLSTAPWGVYEFSSGTHKKSGRSFVQIFHNEMVCQVSAVRTKILEEQTLVLMSIALSTRDPNLLLSHFLFSASISQLR
jgi:hypothetical protein